jgi:hypothetical protein
LDIVSDAMGVVVVVGCCVDMRVHHCYMWPFVGTKGNFVLHYLWWQGMALAGFETLMPVVGIAWVSDFNSCGWCVFGSRREVIV